MSTSKGQVHEVLKDILSAEKVEFNGTVATIMVTPDMAFGWLSEYNTCNRKISLSALEKYKKVIQRNDWMLNGEAILFSQSGRLLDGQHRLRAVIETGISIPVFVVFGLPEETFDTLDDGKRRDAGNVLSILGYKHYTTLASAARLAYCYFEISKIVNHSGYNNSNHDLRSYIEKHPSLVESVGKYIACRSLCSPSLLAFCHFVFTKIDKARGNAFMDQLVSGEGLAKGSPILCLRNRLFDEKSSRARLPEHDIKALFFKAWNAYRAGKTISRLNWAPGKDEAFPEVK